MRPVTANTHTAFELQLAILAKEWMHSNWEIKQATNRKSQFKCNDNIANSFQFNLLWFLVTSKYTFNRIMSMIIWEILPFVPLHYFHFRTSRMVFCVWRGLWNALLSYYNNTQHTNSTDIVCFLTWGNHTHNWILIAACLPNDTQRNQMRVKCEAQSKREQTKKKIENANQRGKIWNKIRSMAK